ADAGKKSEQIDTAVRAPPDVAVASLFDADWYRKTYRIGGEDDALAHFLTEGFRKGFDPHPLFSTRWYLETNPEVRAEGINPLVHFVTRGVKEMRWPHPLFDLPWYQRSYGSVLGGSVNPFADFISEGWKQGRNPNAVFDVAYYLGRNRDVRRSGMNPLLHFDRFGAKEGRPVSPRFDTGWYRATNPDVGLKNPLTHYLQVGLREGRRTTPTVEEGISTTVGKRSRETAGPSILLVSHTVSSAGHRFGAERSFVDMAASLSRVGCNVHVVLPGNDPGYAEALAPYACDISVFPYSWWQASTLPDDTAIARFKHLIQLKGVDLVYVNTIMLREPCIAAKLLSVRSAVHCRELIDQDEQLANVIGIPPKQIVEAVVERTDLIIANSRATAALYGDFGKLANIIPNVVDTERLRGGIELTSGNVTKVGIISSNLAKKGILDFGEIARRLSAFPDIEFHVFGPETDITRDLRRRQAAGELPTSLIFDGYVDDPAKALESLDIVLCLSTFAESFGRTVAEAMAAKCLVIGYRLGAIPELIEHRKTGLLVDVGDVSAVANLISDFSKEPKHFSDIREEGRRFIENFHAPTVMDA
ncbi:MAG TPA: glycosyltransferase family 4 protein, partial [Hyphomonadaceae bacterium]|nr:glycosyltransferase family 4 protein [Hyphomonadaceae bacterium]